MFRQFFCGNIKIIFNSLLYFFIESIFLSNILSVILGITLGIMVSDTPHYENEVPFEVPESWEWQKLGDIGVWQSGATPSRLNKEYYGGNIPWLKTGDLNDGYIQEIPETITQKALEETSVKLNPAGSVLIAMYGATIGKVGILTFPATTNQACCACVEYNGIEQMYLFYFLLSHKEEFIMLGGGGAQPNISKEKIVDTYIPIPPQFEQKRIINAIEQWFALIDTLESAKEDLQMSIAQAKSKILDLAIHGKLVPQDTNDEPAIELLKRINPKFTPCDNAHYENVPNSWCWTTLGEVCELITGSTPSKLHPEYYGGDFPFYKPTDLDVGRHVAIPSEFLTGEGKKVSRVIPVGATAICCIGSIGKCGYIEKEGATNQQINTAVPSKSLHPLYLYYFCNSTFFVEELTADSSAITISIVNKSKLSKMLIPIPPYKEQQRIVSKIEELLVVLDNISAEL